MIHKSVVYEPTGIPWELPVFVLAESVSETTDDAGNVSKVFSGCLKRTIARGTENVPTLPLFKNSMAADAFLERNPSKHEVFFVTDKQELLNLLIGVRKQLPAIIVLDEMGVGLHKPIEAVIAELMDNRK